MIFLSIGLLLATTAAAQLASQTALVGTVTDSGGLVPARRAGGRRQRRARRTPTRPPPTARATTTSSSCGPAPTRSRSRSPASRPSRRPAWRSPTTRWCAPTRVAHSQAASPRRSTSRPGAGAQHRQRDGRARRSASAPSASCRLNGRNVWNLAATTPGVVRRRHERHRPELPRRRPARDPEQPRPRRHQRLVEPARGDQHASDLRRGHRSAGADRQHVGRVRLLSGRPHQRRHQERHQQPRTVRWPTSIRATRSTRAATSRIAPIRRTRAARNQFSFRGRRPAGDPEALRRPQQDVLHGGLRRRARRRRCRRRSRRCRRRRCARAISRK